MIQLRSALGIGLFCCLMASGCERPSQPGGENPSGAAKASDSPGSPAPGSAGTIGVSLLTLDNPFFKVIGDNIESEGKKHGYETIVVNADKDAAKQHAQIKEFIVKKVAAIVLSPCESRAIVPAIQQANAAGIPVFTVDIPCREEGVKIVSQIATDNHGGGKEAARAMIKAVGATGGKVAILHYPPAESARLRVKGFREMIDKHNQESNKKIDIVAEFNSDGSKQGGYKAGLDAVQTHPELVGIFAINDPAALGARAALEKDGKADAIKIVGFDGQPEGIQAIKDGRIFDDPIQYPDQMGIRVVEAIVQNAKGEDPPAEILIPAKLYTETQSDAKPAAAK